MGGGIVTDCDFFEQKYQYENDVTVTQTLSCINIAIAGATSVIPETDVTVYDFLAFHYLLIQNTLWHGDIWPISNIP